MGDREGIVMHCPPVFPRETDEGTLVAVSASYWRDDDTYERGPGGHALLLLPAQVARDLARRLIEEAEKIDPARR